MRTCVCISNVTSIQRAFHAQMVTILHVIQYPKVPEVLIVMMIIVINSILIQVSNEQCLKSASKFPKLPEVPEVLIVMMIIVTMSLLIIVSNRQRLKSTSST